VNSYLFFIGQNHDLSEAEISCVLPQAELKLISPEIIKVTSEHKLNLETLGCRLGGTVKIAQITKKSDKKTLKTDLVTILSDLKAKNYTINLLSSTNDESNQLSSEIKNVLVKKELHPRFIHTTSTGISPVIITKQKAVELTVDDNFNIYHTTWVHNFKHWISRDRKKPYVTPKAGMLPPKLARIMVNLALGDNEAKNYTLLDPFCGTGTILMEAKLLGIKAIGSDLSPEKVAGAEENLNWLSDAQACTETHPARIFSANATNLSQEVMQQVDAIVTEPTLGPPSPKEQKFSDISHGLQKLYLGALKHWLDILKPRGRVVITLPIFHGKNRSFKTSAFIDARENLGYNVLRSDLVFTRPGATIERQIVILEKK